MNNPRLQTEQRTGLESRESEDFITIIAPTLKEVMESFRAQGLADQHYTIVHRAGLHRFSVAGEGRQSDALFDGLPMVAATFVRRLHA